jgi:hypothetical protein
LTVSEGHRIGDPAQTPSRVGRLRSAEYAGCVGATQQFVFSRQLVVSSGQNAPASYDTAIDLAGIFSVDLITKQVGDPGEKDFELWEPGAGLGAFFV